MKTILLTISKTICYLVLLTGWMHSFASVDPLSTETTCDAGFTFQLDDSGDIPVYTFTANEDNPSKTYEWNIGGNQLRSGRVIDHIFFDAGGWMVTLTVSDETDTCTVNQPVNVSLDNQGPTGSCFFNLWEVDRQTLTIAVETNLPWYAYDQDYTIDFGDGTTVTQTQDPIDFVTIVHTYSASGIYEVCQTMSEDGCTYCKEIVIDPLGGLPTCDARFTYIIDSTSTDNWVYTFTADETDSTKQFSWFFEIQNELGDFVLHSFAFGNEVQQSFAAGTWRVQLGVNGDEQCSSSQIISPPNPTGCMLNVTSEPYTSDNLFSFFPVTEPQEGPLYYTMDFGDGMSISEESAEGGPIRGFTYYYQDDGIKNACFTVTDSIDYSCQICKEVNVVLPTCGNPFTYELVNDIDPLRYYLLAPPTTELHDYRWEVDGQEVGNDVSVDFTFSDFGTYEVSLFLINRNTRNACKTSQIITLGSDTTICDAGFTYTVDSTSTDNWIYTFTADETDTTKLFEWGFFGSIQPNYGRRVDHIFTSSDSSRVVLKVIDESGECISDQFIDPPAPNGCFINISQTIETDFETYPWEFLIYPWVEELPNTVYYSLDLGDGEVITGVRHPGDTIDVTTKSYSSIGIKNICFTVTDSASYSCQTCEQVNVKSPTCDAGFTYELDTTYGAWIYTFTASEIDSALNYEWTTFDGGSQIPIPGSQIQYIFPGEGTYPVRLTVFNESDTCSTLQEIYSPATESCTFGLTQQENQVIVKAAWGLNDNWFTDDLTIDTTQYAVENLHYSIDLGDGMVVNGTLFASDSIEWTTPFISDIEHEYSTPGVYDICYTATDSLFYNCQQCKSVTIEESDSVVCDAGFTYTIDSTSTDNWIYTFTSNETEATADRLVWAFEDDGHLYFGREVSHIFTKSDTTTVIHNVLIDGEECNNFYKLKVEAPDPSGCFMNISINSRKTDSLRYERVGIHPWVENISGTVYYYLDMGDDTVYSGEKDQGGAISTPGWHDYQTDGVKNICLTVTDSASYSCQVCEQITVIFPTCNESFTYNPVDSLNTFQYLFSSTVSSDLYEYRWEINGDSVSNDESFEYTFLGVGTYEVSLFLKNAGDGNICVSSQQIVVGSDSTTCPTSFVYSLVDSTNTFRYSFTPLIIDSRKTFLWEIEGGFESTETLLDFTFPDAGLWNVTLNQIENGDTCRTTRIIEVMPGGLHITGSLFADLIPVDGGVISLYKKESTDWVHALDASVINGSFSFNNLASGQYLLHARGDNFIHQAFIPTYFVNGIGWQDAYELNLTGSAEEVKITLIRSQELALGQGEVQGRIMASASEEPYVILLKDRNSRRTVKWTVSGNQDHDFSFDQLPFGQYQLTVERPSHSFSQNIDLTESQARITDLELNPETVLGTREPLSNRLQVYPTVIENFVLLSNTSYAGDDLTIELRSITGQLLMNQAMSLAAGEEKRLDLPELEQGIYFLRTSDEEGKSELTKLIKR